MNKVNVYVWPVGSQVVTFHGIDEVFLVDAEMSVDDEAAFLEATEAGHRTLLLNPANLVAALAEPDTGPGLKAARAAKEA
jgi:hypothetical protein